jgi:hypothetical protein
MRRVRYLRRLVVAVVLLGFAGGLAALGLYLHRIGLDRANQVSSVVGCASGRFLR